MLDDNFSSENESELEQRMQEGTHDNSQDDFQQALERAKQAMRDAKTHEQRRKAAQAYVHLLNTGGEPEEHNAGSSYGGKVPYQKTGNYIGDRHGIYRGKNPQTAPSKGKSGKPSE